MIETRLTPSALRLRRGHAAARGAVSSEGDVLNVRVWNDSVAAVTQGEVADAWFSRYLERPCRLMR